MELPDLRTWIMFYLISFVGLLWATFLSVQGVMLWVSMFLVIVIIGIHFFTLYNHCFAENERSCSCTWYRGSNGAQRKKMAEKPDELKIFFLGPNQATKTKLVQDVKIGKYKLLISREK
jgi:hypothetical protein